MRDILPKKITAGLTFDSTVTLTAYPASDWSLTVLLRGPQSIDLAATADANQHRVSVDAATTANWAAGDYWYSARVTDGAEVLQVEEGTLKVLPDIANVPEVYDGRRHVQKVLDAIEAVIEGRASIDQRRYRINNRELERTPISDLLTLRDRYRDEMRRQKAAAKGQSLLGRPIKVRF